MNEKEILFSNLSIWNKLSDNDKTLIINNSYFKSFSAKEIIHSSVKNCFGLIIVKTGILKATLSSKDGKTTTLFRIKDNDYCVISMSCVLSSINFDIDIIAQQDVTLLILPINIFNSVSKNNIYVENFAYKKMTERLSDVISALEQLSFMSLEQRIEKYITNEVMFYNTDTISITHDELAQNISSSREGVSRTLKQMEKKGIIKSSRGKITLLKKSKDL